MQPAVRKQYNSQWRIRPWQWTVSAALSITTSNLPSRITTGQINFRNKFELNRIRVRVSSTRPWKAIHTHACSLPCWSIWRQFDLFVRTLQWWLKLWAIIENDLTTIRITLAKFYVTENERTWGKTVYIAGLPLSAYTPATAHPVSPVVHL